jgi:hypothetical protein
MGCGGSSGTQKKSSGGKSKSSGTQKKSSGGSGGGKTNTKPRVVFENTGCKTIDEVSVS